MSTQEFFLFLFFSQFYSPSQWEREKWISSCMVLSCCLAQHSVLDNALKDTISWISMPHQKQMNKNSKSQLLSYLVLWKCNCKNFCSFKMYLWGKYSKGKEKKMQLFKLLWHSILSWACQDLLSWWKLARGRDWCYAQEKSLKFTPVLMQHEQNTSLERKALDLEKERWISRMISFSYPYLLGTK